jgi:simple sugar transport system ATP-binding protein
MDKNMLKSKPIIEMKGITKKFGAFGRVTALRNVDFEIYLGEVVGLVGDNGAGKSTLVKILSGIYQPNEGQIYKDGTEVGISSRKDSMELGIETIYQDTALIDQMSIWRDIFLSREITMSLRFLNKKMMRKKSSELLEYIGIEGIDSPNTIVGELSGGQKQSVAIARAIYFKTKILLLDEPTSALSIKESQKVLDFIRNLKKEDITSVFVTHNLLHVYSVADRFVVLSRGRVIENIKKEDTSVEELSKIIMSN